MIENVEKRIDIEIINKDNKGGINILKENKLKNHIEKLKQEFKKMFSKIELSSTAKELEDWLNKINK